METRARFILIGLFTLLGVIATLGFLLWLAKVQVDRSYEQYDILFPSVDGLGQASPVRYNGVDVGQVLSIGLDEENAAMVRVRIEIFSTTPVRADTKAQVASQGVTGVSYVSLAGGSPEAERLEVLPPNDVPIIPSERSAVQALTADAPDLLAEALSLIKDVSTFTGPENREAVRRILENADAAMTNIAQVTEDAAVASKNINAFSERLDTLADELEEVAVAAEATLAEAQGTFRRANTVIDERVPPMLDQIASAVRGIEQSVSSFRSFATNGLPQFTTVANEARGLVSNLNSLTSQISRDPARFFLGNQTPDYRR
ncbi:MAG: MlaD family protein [Cereibacter changlensis]|uniref:MlaD family protein n=1 Tax=Cereibacter changlensis TaxID=402884 RepID=UPI00302A19E2